MKSVFEITNLETGKVRRVDVEGETDNDLYEALILARLVTRSAVEGGYLDMEAIDSRNDRLSIWDLSTNRIVMTAREL